jgi:hypothetical protein
MKKGGIICLVLLLFITGTGFDATKMFSKASLSKNRLILHPVHISFTTIEYFEKEKKFQLLFKIFVDDFDLVLNAKYGKDLKLQEGRWEKSYSKVINDYITEHFKLVVDGKDKTKSSLKLARHEVKEQAMWLYYDFDSKVKSGIFNIQNTLMMDLYPDQKNLLIFVFKGEQEAVQFNNKQIKHKIEF